MPVKTRESAVPEHGDEIPVSVLVDAQKSYRSECAYRRLSPRTREMRESITSKFLWYCREIEETDRVSRATVEGFLAYLPEGHKRRGGRWGTNTPMECRPISDRTNANYFRWLRGFFRWSVQQEFITDTQNPMRVLRAPTCEKKKPPPVSTEQIERLLRITRESAHPLRDETLLLVLYDGGLRVSELCSLVRADVDTVKGTIRVRQGKGRKERIVVVGDETRATLRRYMRKSAVKDRDQETVPLFRAVRGKGKETDQGLQSSGVRQFLQRLKERAGMDPDAPIYPHAFRRGFATSALDAGADTLTVQTQLGHSTPTMTLHYASYSEEQMIRKMRPVSPVDRMKRNR